jgi:ribosomal protein L31E
MANIIKAVLKINPNAELSVSDNDVNTIVWENGTTPIPKADIEAKMAELPTAEEEAAQKETDKSSGKQKLKDLGLTDAEIKALTGA